MIDRTLPMIMVPTKSSEALAIAAFRAGVTDYLPAPVTPAELMSCLRHWLSDHAMNDSKDKLAEVGELIGKIVAMQNITDYIKGQPVSNGESASCDSFFHHGQKSLLKARS